MKEIINTKEKGFTLIELLAVIVVLAVLALIAVPIVLNIINKANKQSEERSIESYARALDYAISECMMENPKLKKGDLIVDNYEVKVSSTNEVCAKIDVSKTTEITGCTYEAAENEKGYNLNNCKIKDNYYNYIDGKVVEEPGITREEDYSIGDEITYNGMKFYVIAPSDTKQDYVTLLKAEPLTADEVNTLKQSTELKNDIYDENGYGGISYSATETCGYMNGSWGYSNCSNDYDTSSIKQILQVWSQSFINDLKEVNKYKVRLITFDELVPNLYEETEYYNDSLGEYYTVFVSNYNWLYNNYYRYWTMSVIGDSLSSVWFVGDDGYLHSQSVYAYQVVRPVINLLKSAIK